MVVVTIVGILAAMALPSYQLAIRQSRADIAAANLRTIWAAERLFWLEYHTYTNKLEAQTPPNVGLVDLGLIDPVMFDSKNYTYTIPACTENTFTAMATSPDLSITMTINEKGDVQSTGITPGFQ
jgi:Tfp pilus assembly protein PilE